MGLSTNKPKLDLSGFDKTVKSKTKLNLSGFDEVVSKKKEPTVKQGGAESVPGLPPTQPGNGSSVSPSGDVTANNPKVNVRFNAKASPQPKTYTGFTDKMDYATHKIVKGNKSNLTPNDVEYITDELLNKAKSSKGYDANFFGTSTNGGVNKDYATKFMKEGASKVTYNDGQPLTYKDIEVLNTRWLEKLGNQKEMKPHQMSSVLNKVWMAQTKQDNPDLYKQLNPPVPQQVQKGKELKWEETSKFAGYFDKELLQSLTESEKNALGNYLNANPGVVQKMDRFGYSEPMDVTTYQSTGSIKKDLQKDIISKALGKQAQDAASRLQVYKDQGDTEKMKRLYELQRQLTNIQVKQNILQKSINQNQFDNPKLTPEQQGQLDMLKSQYQVLSNEFENDSKDFDSLKQEMEPVFNQMKTLEASMKESPEFTEIRAKLEPVFKQLDALKTLVQQGNTEAIVRNNQLVEYYKNDFAKYEELANANNSKVLEYERLVKANESKINLYNERVNALIGLETELNTKVKEFNTFVSSNNPQQISKVDQYKTSIEKYNGLVREAGPLYDEYTSLYSQLGEPTIKAIGEDILKINEATQFEQRMIAEREPTIREEMLQNPWSSTKFLDYTLFPLVAEAAKFTSQAIAGGIKVIGDVGERITLKPDDYYSFADFTSDVVNYGFDGSGRYWTDEILPGLRKSDFVDPITGELVYSPASIVVGSFEQMGQIVGAALGTYGSMGMGMARNAAIVTPMFMATYENNVQLAKDLGYMGTSATSAGILFSMIEGYSELIFPDIDFFSSAAKKEAFKMFLDNFSKGGARMAVTRFIETTGKEIGEEYVVELGKLLATASTTFLPGSTNKIYQLDPAQLLETTIFTFTSAGAGAAVQAKLTTSKRFNDSMMFRMAQDLETSVPMIQQYNQLGKIDNKKSEQLIKSLKIISAVQGQLPNDISIPKRVVISSLYAQISALEEKIQDPNITEEIRDSYKNSIKKLKDYITMVMLADDAEFTKSYNAEVEAQGKQVAEEVKKEHPDLGVGYSYLGGEKMEISQEDQTRTEILNDIFGDSFVQRKADALEQRMKNAEEIPVEEINSVIDGLYAQLESIMNNYFDNPVGKQYAQTILDKIDKLNNYEFATGTKTDVITERKAIQTARASVEKEVGVIQSASGVSTKAGKPNKNAKVTFENGESGFFTIRISDQGVVSFEPMSGAPVEMGPASEVNKSIQLVDMKMASNGMPSSITFSMQGVGSERGRKTVTVSIANGYNQNELLDLAINLRAKEVGTVDSTAFDEAFEEVTREVETKTYPNMPAEPQAAKEGVTQIQPQDAVQVETAGQVPVQPEATVGEQVAQGEPQAEPQVPAQKGLQDQEVRSSDIERRRQEELNTQTTAGYGVIASDYLFTGGRGSMLSTDYLLQALTSSFEYAGKQIDAIRNKYAAELGNIKDDVGTEVYSKMMQEIKDVISTTYQNKKAEDLFDKILSNATGFISREGGQVSSDLDVLNESHKNKINAKYDAELAALNQAEPQAPAQESEEITDQEYDDFVNNGNITDFRIASIANKIKNSQELNEREKSMFAGSTTAINAKLNELHKADLKTPAVEKRQPRPSAQTLREAAARERLDKAIQNLVKSFEGSGITVQIIEDEAEFDALAGIKGANGIFDGENGIIAINPKRMNLATQFLRVLFHESSHPVLNILYNTNRALYDKVLNGMKDSGKKGLPIWQDLLNFGNSYVARGYSQEQVDNEMLTEAIGRIINGEIKLNDIPVGWRQAFIDMLNKIAKLFNLKPIGPVTDAGKFRDFAASLKDVFEQGRSIAEIVGSENITDYQSPFISNQLSMMGIDQQQFLDKTTQMAQEVEGMVIPGSLTNGWIQTGTKNGVPVVKFVGEATLENIRANALDSYVNRAYELAQYPLSGIDVKGEFIKKNKLDSLDDKTKKLFEKSFVHEAKKSMQKILDGTKLDVKEKDSDETIANKNKAKAILKSLVSSSIDINTLYDSLVELGNYNENVSTSLITSLYQKREFVYDDKVKEKIAKWKDQKKRGIREGKWVDNKIAETVFAKRNAEVMANEAESIYNDMKQKVKDNLKFIYDLVNPAIRNLTKLWYDGANVIAQEFGLQYELSLEQTAGIIASQSPQMPWFSNLHLAQAIMDIMKNKGGEVFTKEQFDYYVNSAKKYPKQIAYIPTVKSLIGKRLDELSDYDAGIFVRSYYDLNMSRKAPKRLPSGVIVSYETNDSSFSSYDTIEKGVSIFRNGSTENISVNLGEANKVRNFYNNIVDPTNINSVTIDTHAMAVSLIMPFGASDTEIKFDSGSYAFYSDSYNELARELGIGARELQSITWEAIRAFFPDNIKTSKFKAEIGNIWKRYSVGEISIGQARNEILNKGKDANKTEWSDSIQDWMDGKTGSDYFRPIDRKGDVPGTVVGRGGKGIGGGVSPMAGTDIRQGRDILGRKPGVKPQPSLMAPKGEVGYYYDRNREQFFFTDIEIPNGFTINLDPNPSKYEQDNYGPFVNLYDQYGYLITTGKIDEIKNTIRDNYPVGTPDFINPTWLDLYNNVDRFTLKQLGFILKKLNPNSEWNTMASDVESQKTPFEANKMEKDLLKLSRNTLRDTINEYFSDGNTSDNELNFDIKKDGLGVKPNPRSLQFSLADTRPVMADVVNGFYSPIENRLMETKVDRQSANKWIGFMGKKDEAIYTGVLGWLESKNPQEQVSKKDIMDFMKNNRIEVREVDVKPSDMARTRYENESQRLTLPGEETDYKEILVVFTPKGEERLDQLVIKESEEGLTSEEQKEFDAIQKILNAGEFKSSHWSQPNILVHLRMNTRTDANGNKVLFLEEIQSDWGQTGKKEGFNLTKDQVQSKFEEADKNLSAIESKLNSKYGENWDIDTLTKQENDEYANASTQRAKWGNLIGKDYITGKPMAPFVTDTNAWTKLGLKIALKEAIRQKADALAWTTGEQQNERFDLSKTVDLITVGQQRNGDKFISMDMKGKPGEYILYYDNSGKITENDGNTIPGTIGKNLTDVIGKEITEKILNAKKGDEFKGNDLRVGGKGMNAFYGDTKNPGIVGNVAVSLVGELTGTKPSPSMVEINSVEQPAIEVTPEVKASVKRGMPQFSLMADPAQVEDVSKKAKRAFPKGQFSMVESTVFMNPSDAAQKQYPLYQTMMQLASDAFDNGARDIEAFKKYAANIQWPDELSRDYHTQTVWDDTIRIKQGKKPLINSQADYEKMLRNKAKSNASNLKEIAMKRTRKVKEVAKKWFFDSRAAWFNALARQSDSLFDLVAAYTDTIGGMTEKGLYQADMFMSTTYDGLSQIENIPFYGQMYSERRMFDEMLTLIGYMETNRKMEDKFEELIQLETAYLNETDPNKKAVLKDKRDYVKDYLERNKVLVGNGKTTPYSLKEFTRSNLNMASAERKLTELSLAYPDIFDKLFKRADAYFAAWNTLLGMRLDAGMLSQESYDEMTKYKYVPTRFLGYLLMEVSDETDAKLPEATSDQIERLRGGSEEQLVMAYDESLRFASLSVTRSIQKNKAIETLSRAIDANPNQVTFFKPEVSKRDRFGNAVEWVYDKKNFGLIKYYVDGKIEAIATEQAVSDAFNGRQEQFQMPEGLGYIFMSTPFRMVTTNLNPGFGLAQIVIDLNQALLTNDAYMSITTGALPLLLKDIKLLAGLYLGRASKMMGLNFNLDKEWNELFTEAREYGALISFTQAETFESALEKASKAKTRLSNVGNAFSKVKEKIEKLNTSMEYVTRLAIFGKMKKDLINEYKKNNNGQKPTGQAYDDILTKAAATSMNMLNYNRGGSVIKPLNRVMAYLNVGFQVPYSQYQYAKKSPYLFTLKVSELAVYGVLVGIMLYQMLDDDDKDKYLEYYNRLSAFEKSNYWHYPNPFKNPDDPDTWLLRFKKPTILLPIVNTTEVYAMYYITNGKTQKPDEYLNANPLKQDQYTATIGRDMYEAQPFKGGIISSMPTVNAAAIGFGNMDLYRMQEVVPDEKTIANPWEGLEDPRVGQFFKYVSQIGVESPYLTDGPLSPKRMDASVKALIGDYSRNPVTAYPLYALGALMNGLSGYRDAGKYVPAEPEKDIIDKFIEGSGITQRFTTRIPELKPVTKKKMEFQKMEKNAIYDTIGFTIEQAVREGMKPSKEDIRMYFKDMNLNQEGMFAVEDYEKILNNAFKYAQKVDKIKEVENKYTWVKRFVLTPSNVDKLIIWESETSDYSYEQKFEALKWLVKNDLFIPKKEMPKNKTTLDEKLVEDLKKLRYL